MIETAPRSPTNMNMNPLTGRNAGVSNDGIKEAINARKQKIMTKDSYTMVRVVSQYHGYRIAGTLVPAIKKLIPP